jgi:hypothetical protein
MFLAEFQEGIVDQAVQFHDKLNPLLFDNNYLNKLIRYKLLLIAQNFVRFIDIPRLNLVDVTLSGSNAAYTYTEHSDLDLHLVVEISHAAEFHLKQLFDAKKNQYNFNHDIKIKGIDVELYVQDSKEKHISAGIYSVLDDRWIKEPNPVKVNINDNDVKRKVENYLNKIKRAIKTIDYDKVNFVKTEINKLRKAGLESTGEFGVENLTFKVLRAQGWIDRLRQHLYDLEDRQLSLKERK